MIGTYSAGRGGAVASKTLAASKCLQHGEAATATWARTGATVTAYPTAVFNLTQSFPNATAWIGRDFARSGTITTDFTWNVAAGVGIGGGPGVLVSTDAGGSTYRYKGYGAAVNPALSHTISCMFKTNAVTGTSPNQVAGVGFGTDTAYDQGAAGSGISVMLRQGTTSTADLKLVTSKVISGGVTHENDTSVFVPVANNWYRIEMTITKTGTADTFDVSGKVEDWGADGVALSSTVKTITTVSVVNAPLYAATYWYATLYARQTLGNPIQIYSVDNFTCTNMGGMNYVLDGELRSRPMRLMGRTDIPAPYVGGASVNYALYNETIATNWTAVNATVTGGQADRFGGTTAVLVSPTSTGGAVQARATLTTSAPTNDGNDFCVSADVKKPASNASDYVCINILRNSGTTTENYIVFRFSTAAITLTSASIVASGYADLGNGWYRIYGYMKNNEACTALSVKLVAVDSSSAFSSTIGQDVLFARPMLESSTANGGRRVPGPFLPTTSTSTSYSHDVISLASSWDITSTSAYTICHAFAPLSWRLAPEILYATSNQTELLRSSGTRARHFLNGVSPFRLGSQFENSSSHDTTGNTIEANRLTVLFFQSDGNASNQQSTIYNSAGTLINQTGSAFSGGPFTGLSGSTMYLGMNTDSTSRHVNGHILSWYWNYQLTQAEMAAFASRLRFG